jgi:hypothetical protein
VALDVSTTVLVRNSICLPGFLIRTRVKIIDKDDARMFDYWFGARAVDLWRPMAARQSYGRSVNMRGVQGGLIEAQNKRTNGRKPFSLDAGIE